MRAAAPTEASFLPPYHPHFLVLRLAHAAALQLAQAVAAAAAAVAVAVVVVVAVRLGALATPLLADDLK